MMPAGAMAEAPLPLRDPLCDQGGLNAVISSFASSAMFPKALQVGGGRGSVPYDLRSLPSHVTCHVTRHVTTLQGTRM